MFMHDRFFSRPVRDPKRPDVRILEFYFVMLRIDRDGILSVRG